MWCHTDINPTRWGECDPYTCNVSINEARHMQGGMEPLIDQTLRTSRIIDSMRRNIHTLLVLGGVTVGVAVIAVLLWVTRTHTRMCRSPKTIERHDE
jgi:hypothetical protein